MNSDPHESAAWRTFGMLDADEAAAFDEATRHDPELRNAYREMDCLAVAVAVTATVPIAPRADQLDRLHRRLGLGVAKRVNWLGITGWAAAAVLAMIVVLAPGPDRSEVAAAQSSVSPAPRRGQSLDSPPQQVVAGEEAGDIAISPDATDEIGHPPSRQDAEAKTISKVETKRLIQEIEVLRGKLENFQERDRERFQSVPGMAWPIVMRMMPPESSTESPGELALKADDPIIAAILGDALAAASQNYPQMDSPAARVPVNPVAVVEPSAIPIYDAARDAGTLVVNNLPATTAAEAYNLWVTTKTGKKPVHVGRLPESNARGADSFDFSLGSKATVPSSFILTKDRQGEPVAPSKSNTVLEGPR